MPAAGGARSYWLLLFCWHLHTCLYMINMSLHALVWRLGVDEEREKAGDQALHHHNGGVK